MSFANTIASSTTVLRLYSSVILRTIQSSRYKTDPLCETDPHLVLVSSYLLYHFVIVL